MYIFEILYKSIINIAKKKDKKEETPKEPECDHVFLPIDSTKKNPCLLKVRNVNEGKRYANQTAC